MSNRRNYYRILYAQPDAPFEVIKANYRALMQKLHMHPDVGGDDWNASLLNRAYATLRDPRRRAAYDHKLLAEYDMVTLSGGHRSPPAQPPPASSNRRNYYRILQIQPCAPAPLVDASYRAMKNSLNAPAEVVDQAYGTLRDPARRGAYDASLTHTRSGVASPAPTPPTPPPRVAAPTVPPRARCGPSGYEPLITGYCAFCKTPHRHASERADGAECVECGSPLTPPNRDGFKQTGRTLERMRGHYPIAYYVYWPGAKLRGHLNDLSPTGMRFATDDPVAPGQVLKIEAPRFAAVGEVIHARTEVSFTAVGLKFLTVRFNEQRGSFLCATA